MNKGRLIRSLKWWMYFVNGFFAAACLPCWLALLAWQAVLAWPACMAGAMVSRAGLAWVSRVGLPCWRGLSALFGLHSVTRLGQILPFGRILWVLGEFFFLETSPINRRLFGRYFCQGRRHLYVINFMLIYLKNHTFYDQSLVGLCNRSY